MLWTVTRDKAQQQQQEVQGPRMMRQQQHSRPQQQQLGREALGDTTCVSGARAPWVPLERRITLMLVFHAGVCHCSLCFHMAVATEPLCSWAGLVCCDHCARDLAVWALCGG